MALFQMLLSWHGLPTVVKLCVPLHYDIVLCPDFPTFEINLEGDSRSAIRPSSFGSNRILPRKMSARSLDHRSTFTVTVHCFSLQFFVAFELRNSLLMLYQDYSNIEFWLLIENFSKNPSTQ